MVTVKHVICLLASGSLGLTSAIDKALTRKQSSLPIEQCPGYAASNIKTSGGQVVGADLSLAGTACNTYGTDLDDLVLQVGYIDSAQNGSLLFSMTEAPFSFAITRKTTGEVLFNTSGSQIIFESQYLRLRTTLPEQPHLYGLGEHTDPFMLNTTNYTRTLWSRDAYLIPPGTNLYGNHPVYFDHRGSAGTHGVFLLNSNGMDIKINNTVEDGQYLEYNTLGGILDFYFMAGPSPKQVASQYSTVVGKSAMQPYWGFGFHQCRYGMQDVYEVAAVVANYSVANIPLETMWTDIDYMDFRKVFTLDPLRYPLNLMQQLVDYLHTHQQHYIVMVDPAVAYQDYAAFNNGVDDNAFLKLSNGSIYKGVVWPGVTAFPDWFAPGTQGYWNGEFDSFFSPTTGIDIDALWIDMNEASNFCTYPCSYPEGFAISNGDPPQPPAVRLGPPYPIPGFPADFQPQCVAQVSFNVNASTYYGENIDIIGSAVTLGDGDVHNGVPMGANNYPIWNAVVDLPTNTVITYQYVRAENDGSYIYEAMNRTISTGGCNGTVIVVSDVITTAEGTPSSKRVVKRAPDAEVHHSSFSPPLAKRQSPGNMTGLPGRDLINPPYKIHDAAGSISNLTIQTDLIHANGLAEYDTHNMYGTMMSAASRDALLSRRPTVRPLVITRSTFAGAGRQVGHWLGDNNSDWVHYLISIAELLEFAALFQIPMVGSDVCGYAGNTNDLLCARWATLGAFSPFYRNHDADGQIPQEFYRWPIVAEAAQNAIATRYKLLDYIYTAMYHQHQTGEPLVNPMFFAYPEDCNTFPLQYQYFYGPSVLVAPVTEENSTTSTVYLPDDIFYDFYTYAPIRGTGTTITLTDVAYTTSKHSVLDFRETHLTTAVPLYIKGGSIIPLRSTSANTTTELRTKDFTILVAPSLNDTASGSLYLDDGNSLVQAATSFIQFDYTNGVFSMSGSFGYDAGVSITSIILLGNNNNTSLNASSRGNVMDSKISLTKEYRAKLV
ncbi:hypothetical protein MBLNU459_g2839t3 [Dothideomycetes sp. NU459]